MTSGIPRNSAVAFEIHKTGRNPSSTHNNAYCSIVWDHQVILKIQDQITESIKFDGGPWFLGQHCLALLLQPTIHGNTCWTCLTWPTLQQHMEQAPAACQLPGSAQPDIPQQQALRSDCTDTEPVGLCWLKVRGQSLSNQFKQPPTTLPSPQSSRHQ